MKRLILLVLLSMLMVFALSACGGSTADPAVEEPAAAEPTAEVAAEEQPVVENLECTDALGCVEVAPGDPIQLASALVISGPNTELYSTTNIFGRKPEPKTALAMW